MLDALKDLHRAELEPILGAPAGASSDEICQLEYKLGLALPKIYRDILAWMGNDRKGVLAGSDCFMEHVERSPKWLPRLLKENVVHFSVSSDFIVFFSHQGYQVAWFDLPTTVDDPPIWFFNEGSTNSVIKVKSVSEFFQDQLRELIPSIKQNGRA